MREDLTAFEGADAVEEHIGCKLYQNVRIYSLVVRIEEGFVQQEVSLLEKVYSKKVQTSRFETHVLLPVGEVSQLHQREMKLFTVRFNQALGHS